MEQKFDGNPSAEIRVEGKKLIRSEVANDWGLLLQWQISRDGQVVATAPARADTSFELAETTPGNYEAVLQMWKYVDYKKNAAGEFLNSKFVEVSNKVSFKI